MHAAAESHGHPGHTVRAELLDRRLYRHAAIVDPGGDVARRRAAIDELKVTPQKILLTHGHIDHAGGAAELSEVLSIPIEGPHEADAFLLSALEAQGARFGMTDVRSVTPTRWLTEGETVDVGDVTFSVLLVPGHTPGHIVFVNAPSPSGSSLPLIPPISRSWSP